VIGMCAAIERARWGVWEQPAALLSLSYVAAVQRAGGLAMMLPPDPLLVEEPEQVLGLIDGLLLAGGADIDPSAYGRPRHPETIETVPERDAFELALTRAALERDLPVLGICRGMQLINVALGGTLSQHLPERFGHSEHRRAIGSFDGSEHDVDVCSGTLAMRVIDQTPHSTKSHHHQGVDELGEGLTVSATSAMDGLAEAIELPGRRFVLGVQWHPEADESSPLLGGLVEAARAHHEAQLEADHEAQREAQQEAPTLSGRA
jgi:putative glutamine amidotransferase